MRVSFSAILLGLALGFLTEGCGDSGGSSPPPASSPSGVLSISTVSLPPAPISQPYNSGITTSGGTAPLAFSVISGALPAGLTLDPASGALVGTPNQIAIYPFTVQVRDAVGATASKGFELGVSENPDIMPDTLPTGIRGTPYDQSFQASGGIAPYTWMLESNSTLPPGMSFDAASGRLSGTPSASGSYTITISAGEAAGFRSIKQYVLTIQ